MKGTWARLIPAVLIAVLLCGFSVSAQVPDALKPYVDRAISHVQANSLYREKVDWNTLRDEVYLQARDAKTVEELAPALRNVLSKLTDSHGKFIYKNKILAYWNGPLTENQKKIDSGIWNEIQSGKYSFKSEMLNNRIGYLRVTGLPMGDNVKMSAEIRNAVCSLKTQKATRWIIDLRYNGGGNMYPMMEGLGTLIGDGLVGKVSDASGKTISNWTIKDGDFYYDNYLAADLPNDCKFEKLPKVAVLISQYTASSGEAVAVALKGRPGTRFFGLETAGLVTVTDWTPINSDLFASVSIGYYADRNGKIYNNFVEPDEKIEIVLTEDKKADQVLQRAILWLKK